MSKNFKKTLSMILAGLMIFVSSPIDAIAVEKGETPVASPGIQYDLDSVAIDQDYTSDELLMVYFDRELMDGTEGVMYGADRGPSCFADGSVKKKMYDALKARSSQIADGQNVQSVISYPASELLGKSVVSAAEIAVPSGGGTVTTANLPQYFSAWANSVFSINDAKEVFDAVKMDCPYEFYWAGLSLGGGLSGSYGYSGAGDTVNQVDITNMAIVIKIDIAEDFALNYRSGVFNTTPNTTATAAAKTAANNARTIVANATSYDTDYAKMKYYLDTICSLTDYNHDAANGTYGKAYGNPWQLIWTFDGDPSTKVVCEGYSKSFKYLCDMTNFDSTDVYCSIVTGSCGGPHMWNVVTMDDGKNYLVDATNCDITGASKYDLFVSSPASGSVDSGYIMRRGYQSITYTYDSDTKSIYTTTELTLSNAAYVEPTPGVTKYTITLDANGGTISPSTVRVSSIRSKDDLPVPTPPTGSSYDEYAWYTAAVGGTEIQFPYNPISNQTIYVHWSTKPENYEIKLTRPSGYTTTSIWVDGAEYAATLDGSKLAVTLPDGNGKIATMYNYTNGKPTGMTVWMLTYSNKQYTAETMTEFTNLLGHAGFQAKIAGQNGIRCVSEINTTIKSALKTTGVNGFKIEEMGVCYMKNTSRKSEANPSGLDFTVANVGRGKSRCLYKENGKYVDTVCGTTEDKKRFAASIVGVPDTKAQYNLEVAFRSYCILVKDGQQYIIYGAPVTESMASVVSRTLATGKYAPGSSQYEMLNHILEVANQ